MDWQAKGLTYRGYTYLRTPTPGKQCKPMDAFAQLPHKPVQVGFRTGDAIAGAAA